MSERERRPADKRNSHDESFCLQNLHVPQAIWNETTTLSPIFLFLTLGPTRSTTPMNSSLLR
jgi:hypothetical protein